MFAFLSDIFVPCKPRAVNMRKFTIFLNYLTSKELSVDAYYFYASHSGGAVRGEWAHKCVVRVRGNINFSVVYGNHNGSVVKIARGSAQLNQVSRFKLA